VVVSERGLPPRVMFDVTATSSGRGDAQLAVARMQANAAQAWAYGLGRVRAEDPPPLYAFDPDTGRLAITTPTYNTAIVPVNQGAFPYGGVELARLFDGDQRVAANIGGRPRASFGMLVVDRRTGRQTATQRARHSPDLAHPPLRLVEAPYGAGRHPIAYPRHAYAGPFRRLEVVGTTVGRGFEIHTRHRFSAGHVQTSWRLLAEHPHGDHDVQLLLPSTGHDTTVTATLRDGRRVVVGRVRLRDVAWLHVHGSECGYVIVPASRALEGHVRLAHPETQSTAPHAGPTVVFELIHAGTLHGLDVSVRIAPARSGEEARRAALAG
jgi:hypothetical protein